MKQISYSEIQGNSPQFYSLAGLLIVFLLSALGSAYYMEHHGHFGAAELTQILVAQRQHIRAIHYNSSGSWLDQAVDVADQG